MLVGCTFGVPIAALVAYIWVVPLKLEPTLKLTVSTDSFNPMLELVLFLLVPFVFLAGLILVHELIHALACPRFGFTRATVFGIWPSKFIAYAAHLGPISHRRGIILATAPFVVLSIGPRLVELVTHWHNSFLPFVSIVNALVCGGDAFISAMFLVQIPLNASIRNKGWYTWWRPAEASAP